MTELNRKASAFWSGDSRSGKGLISTESKALHEQPYDYQTRFGAASGTNPEELIAAAHAACFSMALASTLKKKGYEPQKTDTNASCTVSSKNGGYEITKMQLHVSVEVADIDNPTFQKIVMEADKVCPVSNLLRESIDIKIDAALK